MNPKDKDKFYISVGVCAIATFSVCAFWNNWVQTIGGIILGYSLAKTQYYIFKKDK